MNGFHDREKAFEVKYLHDEELAFKINTKRNRLFASWAANILGHEGQKATDYIDKIILIDLQNKKGETVLQTVIIHLKEAEVDMSEHRIQQEYEKCHELALKAIMEKKEE
ncbi:MAG: DUF1476 domain-containing protein [Alphaproteobacteria bacterium]|nr:DUF1476 domain-containing protein [Alphaproteobacteria bacterium]